MGAYSEQALQLREIQRRGVESNVVSYKAAVSACERGARPEQPLELLRERQWQSAEPDVIGCSSTISAQRLCEGRAARKGPAAA